LSAPAARTAAIAVGGCATAFVPLLFNFTNANLDDLVPAQSLFGPAAFGTYWWMKRHYGRERTMAEYSASSGDSRLRCRSP
jgi:hypothetical protein